MNDLRHEITHYCFHVISRFITDLDIMKHLFDLFLAVRQPDTIRCYKLSYVHRWSFLVLKCLRTWKFGQQVTASISCGLSGNCLDPDVNCCTECHLTTV